MAQWVKLIGSSQPPSARVPNHWHAHGAGDTFQFESGPRGRMPPFEIGDEMILVAAGWSRAYAALEIAGGPEWSHTPRWGPKWPWVLHGRLVAWFPQVEDAPKPLEIGLPRSYGGAYQQITEEQYDEALRQFESRGAVTA